MLQLKLIYYRTKLTIVLAWKRTQVYRSSKQQHLHRVAIRDVAGMSFTTWPRLNDVKRQCRKNVIEFRNRQRKIFVYCRIFRTASVLTFVTDHAGNLKLRHIFSSQDINRQREPVLKQIRLENGFRRKKGACPPFVIDLFSIAETDLHNSLCGD